jgi:hypothetical protein
MTAYLYAHNVRIFATTRFLPGPTAIDCGKTRNGWLRKAGSKSSSSARGTSAKRIWSKPSWPSAGDNWGWWPSFPWNLVPPARWCQSRPFRANRQATYSADFAGADLRDQALKSGTLHQAGPGASEVFIDHHHVSKAEFAGLISQTILRR